MRKQDVKNDVTKREPTKRQKLEALPVPELCWLYEHTFGAYAEYPGQAINALVYCSGTFEELCNQAEINSNV
jgi:hypothetical protein